MQQEIRNSQRHKLTIQTKIYLWISTAALASFSISAAFLSSIWKVEKQYMTRWIPNRDLLGNQSTHRIFDFSPLADWSTNFIQVLVFRRLWHRSTWNNHNTEVFRKLAVKRDTRQGIDTIWRNLKKLRVYLFWLTHGRTQWLLVSQYFPTSQEYLHIGQILFWQFTCRQAGSIDSGTPIIWWLLTQICSQKGDFYSLYLCT